MAWQLGLPYRHAMLRGSSVPPLPRTYPCTCHRSFAVASDQHILPARVRALLGIGVPVLVQE